MLASLDRPLLADNGLEQFLQGYKRPAKRCE